MKGLKKPKLPRQGKHTTPKPHLRTRRLSTVGKSAYGAAPGGPAFPDPGMGAGGGAPAFAPGGAAPPDLDGGSPPLTGPGGGPPGQ